MEEFNLTLQNYGLIHRSFFQFSITLWHTSLIYQILESRNTEFSSLDLSFHLVAITVWWTEGYYVLSVAVMLQHLPGP